MAAIAQYFQTPNNITSGTWNWGDVAYGFRSGLLLNHPPLNVIHHNNFHSNDKLTSLTLIRFVMFPSITLSKVARLARSENWMAHLEQFFISGAYVLMAANIFAARTKVYQLKFSQARTSMQKFLVAVWRATPYLVLLTNIALTIIEFRINRMKALVGLTVMAVTLLNQTRVIPRSFAWYINPGIRLPMDLVALYYGSNINRFTIVVGWTTVPIIRDPIMARLIPYLNQLGINF